MDPVTAAAKEGNLLVFALTISGILLALTLSAIWWLIKARMAERMRKDDLLERRLNAGNTKFEAMSQEIDKFKSGLVTSDRFEKYCESHKRDHERIESAIDRVDHNMESINGRLSILADMLAKKLEVGFREDYKND